MTLEGVSSKSLSASTSEEDPAATSAEEPSSGLCFTAVSPGAPLAGMPRVDGSSLTSVTSESLGTFLAGDSRTSESLAPLTLSGTRRTSESLGSLPDECMPRMVELEFEAGTDRSSSKTSFSESPRKPGRSTVGWPRSGLAVPRWNSESSKSLLPLPGGEDRSTFESERSESESESSGSLPSPASASHLFDVGGAELHGRAVAHRAGSGDC